MRWIIAPTADGMVVFNGLMPLLPADGLQKITRILLDLHAWAASTPHGNLRGKALSELREKMRHVVGAPPSFQQIA